MKKKTLVRGKKVPAPSKKKPVLIDKTFGFEDYFSVMGLARIRLLDKCGLGCHSDMMPILPRIIPRPNGMEGFLTAIFKAVENKVQAIPPSGSSA